MNYLRFLKLGSGRMMGELLPRIYVQRSLVHLSDRLIVLRCEGSFISVLSFVRENIQHQYKIYELMARDMLVHPMHFRASTEPEPLRFTDRPLWTRKATMRKSCMKSFLLFLVQALTFSCGKDAIITVLEIVSFNRQERGKSA